MGAREDHFVAWARTALTHYPLATSAVRVLGHSENLTFQVVEHEHGATYLLRLHRPSTANFAGLRQQPVAIASELQWLVALRRDTAITVQEPVRNTHGHFVTSITVPAVGRVPCTLLRWVAGEPFDPLAPAAGDLVAPYAQLVARLHQHAKTWHIPASFVRPSYGPEFFRHVVALLHPGIAGGVITPRDFVIIRQTIEGARALMLSREQADHQWGLIHNDLHPGNCVVLGAEMRPIDFSLCGFGYFLFDLSTCVGSLSVELRQGFLDAYSQSQPLPSNAVRLIEACLIVSRMSYYAYTLPNVAQQAWLKQRIPQVVETICQRFLNNESFLFDIR